MNSPCLLVASIALLTATSAPDIVLADSAEVVRFATRPARIGDRIDQAVGVEMQLKTRARRGAEILEESETRVERFQRRLVTATEVVGPRVIAARVEFLEGVVSQNGESNQEPVVGKAYRCRRDSEKLLVTDESGQLPPMAEYEVVARAMETLGTPSPLARFLAGREIAVGEQVQLPADVAQRALGFDDQLGSVKRFTLLLEEIETQGTERVAKFGAEIEAVGSGSGQMRLIVEGPVAISESTCRVVSTELSGPIGLMQSRGGMTAGYSLDGSGRLSLQTASRYHDVRR